jgi:hypothetical protein
MPRPKGYAEKPNYLGIRLSDKDKEKLQKYADREGITMTEAIERFIRGLDVT